ncbi:Folate-binding protein YgfZ [Candidatus Bealeia paramacronuclearis]|uniref:Folate-binding protein YgfZ n=1 Tax=Candidatus Bealeia paramacronuclearis TaxID=1921001 RepID=A0ABZ2C1X5_9PROT|nr:Folate-binding protein YgfZ [Candidatus Bealeia paramacronuclearis]
MELLSTRLPSRGLLKISGKDRFLFLQGIITNDIYKLENVPIIYSALLTPQGKFLFDFFVYAQGDVFLLECQEGRLPELMKKLSLYKLRSQVVFEDVSSDYDIIVGAPVPGLEAYFNEDPRLPDLGIRGVVPVRKMLGQVQDDIVLYNAHRISLGVPDGSVDLIPDKSILLENGMDELQAIDWKKGCYMGQELTARTRYRGLVRKRLFPLRVEGEAPAFGEKICYEGDEVGEMRSSQNEKGLALIRLEAFQKFQEKGEPFTYQETRLFPYCPDWMDFTFPEESTKSENPPGNS